MATRQLLSELAVAYTARTQQEVLIESVGGVDAAKRVQAGEAFDFVVLADDAIDKLTQAGAVVAGSKLPLVRSGVAACVRAGGPRWSFDTPEQVRQAVVAALGVGYSTGPSGTALIKLFEQWGIQQQIAPKLVQARPGVPVGEMVAQGEVALGFQQLSELMHVAGIEILGPLPAAIQVTTVFAAGVCATAHKAQAAVDFLSFMAGPDATAAKLAQGMTPA